MKSTTEESADVPFLDLVGQYEEIREEIDDAITSVLSSASFIGGTLVKEFERSFAAYLGVEHCVGVANGTDAIEIALETMDLPCDTEIIVPANSFIASSEAVTRAGCRVVFADVDSVHYVLDPEDVERRVTDNTGGILAVHLYGHPAPMPELLAIAERRGLWVLEDAAQAHGAKVHGASVGTLGKISTFSFYPGKNLGAYGDAGAITTQDASLEKRMRMRANHGRSSKYEHDFEGRNSRLDSLQAAVLSVKLRYLDAWTDRRRALAARYQEGLAGVGDLVLPSEHPDFKHVYHLYVVRTESRNELQGALRDAGITTGIHYPVALPRLKAYAAHPQRREDFFAEKLSGHVLSLPIGDSIAGGQVDRVIEAVRTFFDA